MSSDVLLAEDPTEKCSSRLIENAHVSIDITLLYDVSGNDINFIRSTVQAFLKKMPPALDKIEESFHTGDWDSVYELSHSVRSSISIIKIDELFDWVTQIEANAKNRTNLNNMRVLIRKIKGKYKFAEVVLNERFQAKKDISQ